MAIIATASEDKTYKRLDSGTYRMKLVDMNTKTKFNKWKQRDEEKIVWRFDTVDEKREDGTPYAVFHETGFDYGSEKAHLTLFINKIYNRPFSPSEFEGFNLQSLEGLDFKVTVVKEVTANGEFNNIAGIQPVNAAQLPMPPGVGAAVDPEEEKRGPRLTDAQKKKLVARLKLSEDEAVQMDAWGNMPDDEDYAGTDFGDPFKDE